MKSYQQFALNHYLSDYPIETDFKTILSLIEDEHESITIWQPFEDHPRDDLIDFISHLAHELEEKFISLVDVACVIDRATIKEMLHEDIEREPTDTEVDRVSEFIDNDFSYQLAEKVFDAITYCNISCSTIKK